MIFYSIFYGQKWIYFVQRIRNRRRFNVAYRVLYAVIKNLILYLFLIIRILLIYFTFSTDFNFGEPSLKKSHS